MAKIHGHGGVMKVGGPTGDVVGQLQSWNIDPQVAVTAAYSMGESWEDNETTVGKWSGSCEVYFDPEDAGQISLDIGDVVNVIFYPGGEVSGLPTRSGLVAVTGAPISASKDGWVSMTINFVGKGALIKGTVS